MKIDLGKVFKPNNERKAQPSSSSLDGFRTLLPLAFKPKITAFNVAFFYDGRQMSAWPPNQIVFPFS